MDGVDLRSELEALHRESYGWALCCCARDRGRAEEVVQGAYLKVLEGKARCDGRSGFKTWLFAVIRRTAAEERRRNLLHRLRLNRYQPPITPEEQPDARLWRSELQEAFRQALATLPRRQQQVLQLVFYHDLSLSDAAQVIGVSVGSARVHYDRGKKAIRKQFEENSHAIGTRSRTIPGLVF